MFQHVTGVSIASGSMQRLALPAALTRESAQALRRRLFEPMDNGRDVEVDLAAVCHIDAAGLQLLLAARLHALAKGRQLRLTRPSAAVLDFFGALGAGGVLQDDLQAGAMRLPAVAPGP